MLAMYILNNKFFNSKKQKELNFSTDPRKGGLNLSEGHNQQCKPADTQRLSARRALSRVAFSPSGTASRSQICRPEGSLSQQAPSVPKKNHRLIDGGLERIRHTYVCISKILRNKHASGLYESPDHKRTQRALKAAKHPLGVLRHKHLQHSAFIFSPETPLNPSGYRARRGSSSKDHQDLSRILSKDLHFLHAQHPSGFLCPTGALNETRPSGPLKAFGDKTQTSEACLISLKRPSGPHMPTEQKGSGGCAARAAPSDQFNDYETQKCNAPFGPAMHAKQFGGIVPTRRIANTQNTLRVLPQFSVKRISKPGRRIYIGWKLLSYRVFNTRSGSSLNETFIIRTSKGLMSAQEAISRRIGGELLFKLHWTNTNTQVAKTLSVLHPKRRLAQFTNSLCL